MPRGLVDLEAIVRAVEIRAADSFSVRGERFDLEPAEAEAGVGALTAALARALYQRMYCRPEHAQPWRGPDTRATRVYVDTLSQANSGSGTWEPGWEVVAQEDDGTFVVRKQRDDLTLWARPEQFRPAQGAVGVGSIGRLRLGKELREMLPGYYTVLGDADQQSDDDGRPVPVVRFYWHLTVEASGPWIHELTRRFNAASVPFHAKVLSDPSAYVRADAGVLYVASADVAAAMALLPALHTAVARQLRATTPMFTRRLARGLAVAEDPGDGRSFGQHRCQLVAEGLVRAFEAGSTAAHRVAATVSARFAEEGLDITRPWLNAGSQDTFAWPVPRRRAQGCKQQP